MIFSSSAAQPHNSSPFPPIATWPMAVGTSFLPPQSNSSACVRYVYDLWTNKNLQNFTFIDIF